MALSKEEEKRRKELAKEYQKEIRERKESALKKMKKVEREFAEDFGVRMKENKYPELRERLFQGLNDGTYESPSQFVEKELSFLFENNYIYPRFKEGLKYALDHMVDWPYARSYYRRPFRSRIIYLDNLLWTFQEYRDELTIDADLCDILTLNLPEKELAFFLEHGWNAKGYCENQLAYELSQENEKLTEIMMDIINGDGAIPIDRELIRGIVKSTNEKLHQQLGKLLLAAKLQEGLRQTICENMDCGTKKAFMTLLKVLDENQLIRYSSVKRAVGTWLGLVAEESGDLERISEKSVSLIIECLNDEKRAEEYLQSEDSMQIYIALWSFGFHDIAKASSYVTKLSLEGSHHQILTAGYFIKNLDRLGEAHKLAKKVIPDHLNEYDVLAVFLPYFLRNWRDALRTHEFQLDYYFESREEAKRYYDLMWKLYEASPKKKIEVRPCIFPWHSETYSRADVVTCICVIASLLDDVEKLDAASQIIKDASYRSGLIELLLQEPKSAILKAVLTECLADKESYARGTAIKIAKMVSFDTENYRKMEEMLKYKAADIRGNLIELLYGQEDLALQGTVERLLADKKEEKRTAGLDIVMRLEKDEKRTALFKSCKELVSNLADTTDKEQILIDNILGNQENAGTNQETEALFDKEKDKYVPNLEMTENFVRAFRIFEQYFPATSILDDGNEKNGIVAALKKRFTKDRAKDVLKNPTASVLADCESLHQLFLEHKMDEYKGYGNEVHTLGEQVYNFRESIDDGTFDLPLLSVWKEWYEKQVNDKYRLFRMYVLLSAYNQDCAYVDETGTYIETLYGKGYSKYPAFKFNAHLFQIVERLMQDYMEEDDLTYIAMAIGYWYVKEYPDDKVLIDCKAENWYGDNLAHFIAHAQIESTLSYLTYTDDERFSDTFKLGVWILQKSYVKPEETTNQNYYYGNCIEFRIKNPNCIHSSAAGNCGGFKEPDIFAYLIAAKRGEISEAQLFCFIFDEKSIDNNLNQLSLIAMGIRESGRQVAKRGEYGAWQLRNKQNAVALLLGKGNQNPVGSRMGDAVKKEEAEEAFTKEEQEMLAFADSVYEKTMEVVLSTELRRGDTETEYSKHIRKIERIYGMKYFIAILKALGKDTLERSTYFSNDSKKGVLSRLLSVCIPCDDDNANQLAKALEGTKITEKRLLEAALYSPEWMDIIGEYLKWDGFKSACYYFMAHMNERFDDQRKARIAKYTPLNEDELNSGAFDIAWFRSAYETLGAKRFDLVYDAAKYISDGSKHSRARKYADAALGNLKEEEVKKAITEKRNKDFVMAYPLMPIKDEADMVQRYLFLQEFLKSSKKYGAQRIASEKKAVEMAMYNLAMNAGYTDVTRLTLRMETKVLEESKALFEEKELEDVVVYLQVEEDGKTELICKKNDKLLKAVPAKLKKNEYIVKLQETKKRLLEQYRRTKVMFEQAMEDGVEFAASEIMELQENPVIAPIIKNLVFVAKDQIGYIKGSKLVDYAGKETKLAGHTEVIVAHPIHLFKDGHWTDYQKDLFDREVKQCFKQVFRELYVKTDEELELNDSRRYSGNQIQPKKTVGCLKSRRWVADVEDGLQKVYYKENIVARIYALADWFSPADIEAPTLEWVEFSDRKTGKPIQIKDIPDVIFSEVMRDVDMAVSVAHAGGVDPETSHSTIEMRSAILSLTLPLFKIHNVTLQKNHAVVENKYGTFTIHLGSGVIHKQGGAMIHVLPVHSAHRGRVFLPFVDDDPKTAEIITKVLTFAEDDKLKDPTILEQIR